MEKIREKIKLLQIAYTSEWALAKFFPAVFHNGILENFILTGISGREEDREQARERIKEEIEKIKEYKNRGEVWRAINLESELNSLKDILENLNPLGLSIDYHKITNGSISLPDADYTAAVIFSKNPTHMPYIQKLIQAGIDVICEKPIVVVTDKENHRADRSQLNQLESLVLNSERILMDAEHYSAKKHLLFFMIN